MKPGTENRFNLKFRKIDEGIRQKVILKKKKRIY